MRTDSGRAAARPASRPSPTRLSLLRRGATFAGAAALLLGGVDCSAPPAPSVELAGEILSLAAKMNPARSESAERPVPARFRRPAPRPQPGEPFDAAPFGQVVRWGEDLGILWEDPRDISEVRLEFDGKTPLPEPGDVKLLYWASRWPQEALPRDKAAGSGQSGWRNLGDWYQGIWQRADTTLTRQGRTWIYRFNRLTEREYPALRKFDARYRSTMKLRVAGAAKLAGLARIRAITDSTWQPLSFEVEWAPPAGQPSQGPAARVEAFNGYVDEPRVQARTPLVASISALRSSSPAADGYDDTVITVRAPGVPFSFSARNLERSCIIFVPDLGALVRMAGNHTSYAEAEAEWRARRQAVAGRDFYTRVAEMPEQTLTAAWAATPPKQPHYIPLSFEGTRDHFGLDEHGNIYCDRRWVKTMPGGDTPRCDWDQDRVFYRFGLPAGRVQRTLIDGCLPIARSTWVADGVRYTQTAFAEPLAGVPPPGYHVRADDPTVLLMRIEMSLAGRTSASARLRFGYSDGRLQRDGDLLSTVYSGRKVGRERILLSGRDATSALSDSGNTLGYSAALTPDEPRRTVVVAIPYGSIRGGEELTRVRSLDFERELAGVRAYWHSRIDAVTQIVTPEPMINEFYRAHMGHLLIDTERDIHSDNRYMAKVGTFGYGVYSNESAMMIADLDRRGFHDRAQRALDTFLHYQGTAPLPGHFTDTDGLFYGAGGYEEGGYSQDHGWILWCLAEHFRYTGDKAWLSSAAAKIVAGCDWIERQRRAAAQEAASLPIRAIERGLMPPARLEDIEDWRSWLSTNVYSWWGMDSAARALAAIEHPEAPRIQRSADAFRKDLVAAFEEAAVRSPVVSLRDGSWIPHVPASVHRRGRSFGWITETLEGAISLIQTGAIPADDRLATWIVRDYEDNLFLSQQYGYPLAGKQLERLWFDRGGISMQANMLPAPQAYLKRDDVKQFLRSYFNAFAVSYFPDTRMMTEHALPRVGDWFGDHYKASDEANSCYWLRQMFVQERGDSLWLGAAIPRYWLADGRAPRIQASSTYFGRVSMSLRSEAKQGRITMVIYPPLRAAPREIVARFRHPAGQRMIGCTVNGVRYDRFDPAAETVTLAYRRQKTVVTALYSPMTERLALASRLAPGR